MTRTRVRRRRTVAALVALLLAVPVAAAATSGAPEGPENRYQRYLVRSGDTLWGISQAQGESDPRALVDAISQANGLQTSVLVPGQVLRIPLP